MRTGRGVSAKRGLRFISGKICRETAHTQRKTSEGTVKLQGAYHIFQDHCLDQHSLRVQEATAEELANIAWALAKLRKKAIFESVSRESISRLAIFDESCISKFMWSFATLDMEQSNSVRLLAKEASLRCREFSARNVSCLVWSFARLRLNDTLLLRTIFAEVRAKVNEFGSRDVSMCAWGMAKLSVQDAPLMDLLLKKALLDVSDSKLQDLSNLTWALATFDVARPHFFRAVAQQPVVYVASFSTQDCANLAWAFAKAHVYESKFFDVLVEAASANVKNLEPRHVSNICWSFAKLQLHVWSLIRGLDSHACNVMKEFKPQEISNLLWAAAVLHPSDVFFLHEAVKRTLVMLHQFKAQELSTVVWSLATFRYSDNDVYLSLSKACIKKHRGIGPQGLSNLFWAYATVSVHTPTFFQEGIQSALVHMRDFKPQELGNLAWALAKLQCKDTEFFSRLVDEFSAHSSEFTLQNLSNVAWALATVDFLMPNLSTAFCTELSRRLRALDVNKASEAFLVGVVTSVMGIVWALSLKGVLAHDTMTAAKDAITSIGQRFDQKSFKNVASRHHPRPMCTSEHHVHSGSDARLSIAPKQDMPTSAPHIVLNLADRLAIYKPPHWEVYPDVAAGAGPATQHQLSWHLQRIIPQETWQIGHDALHQHGFLHRLDVPSSGLILVAKTYTAFYDMQLQLNTGQLERDYLALCHGWITSSRIEVNAALFWQHGGVGRGAAGEAGQPALTRLKVLAHAARHGERFSLVAIRIATGRRHQIRVHMAHIGHPVVCDGRYTTVLTFGRDQEWCSSNFLHRYRVAFRDSSGDMHQVMEPLHPELSASFSQLLPRDAQSKEALNQWAQSPMYSWDDCVPL